MDKHGDGRVSRAELIRALQVDRELRTLLGLPAHIGDAERRVFEATFQELDSGDSHFGADDFVLYLIHHRLAHGTPAPAAGASAAASPAAAPTDPTTKSAPAVRVHRTPVMPVLRPRGPGGARFSGLDTSASKTWPWQVGVNTAWSDLEIELLTAIAACLKPRDVVRAAGVCGSWRRVILRRCQIDTTWATMFTEKFGRLPRDCVGTSAAQRKFLQTEATLRTAFRTRKLTMSLNPAAVGGWIYSVSCGAGFVLGGSLCGAAIVMDGKTGEVCKRLDGHRPTPPGKIGTDCDPAATDEQPAHHEQFYCCAVAAAAPLYENDTAHQPELQVVLGSNHALRFVRLPAGDSKTANSYSLDESEDEEPEPEEAEETEAQLSYEQFTWLVRRQCRISKGQCPDNALRQLFDYVDEDRSGCISGTEFATFLKQDKIGTFSVFDTAMAHIEAEFNPDKGYSVHSAFKAIDKDGSGALDVDELEAALSLLGLKLSRAEVMIVLAGLDEDGNGEIDATEFKKGMKLARRKAAQRVKASAIKKKPAKCEHTGDEKLDADHVKMQELIATAFLRLYERLERKPDDDAESSMESSKENPVPVPVGGATAASKKERASGGNCVMRAFRDLDEDDSGSLNPRELRAAFAQLGVVLNREALAEVMAELDSDGSGTVDLAELLDRAFVARLEAVRRRVISSAVLMSSNEDEWGELFERYARGQKDTMEGPTAPHKIQSMADNLGRNSAGSSSPAGGARSSPNVVATSEEHGWITQVAMVGNGGSSGSKQWRAAETVAVGYQDGTVESWSIKHRKKIWTVPQAHKADDGDGNIPAMAGGAEELKTLVGLAVIAKGDPKLEEVSPAAIGQPPVFENAVVVSAGRWDGVQLRDAADGQCLRVIDTSHSLRQPNPRLKVGGSSSGGSSAGAVETTAICTFRHSVVCGGADGVIRVWAPDGALKYTLLPDRTLVPPSGGNAAAYMSSYAAEKPAADASVRQAGEVGRIVCLAANADRIAAVDAYGTLRIWEPTCSSEHIPVLSSQSAPGTDTAHGRARQRYFSRTSAEGREGESTMVAPQFAARHGETGWLVQPIWSISWDGASKLWCGLESGHLAALNFSEEGTKRSPLVFRPPPVRQRQDPSKTLKAKRSAQRQRTIDRLSRPSPRWSTKEVVAEQEKLGQLFSATTK